MKLDETINITIDGIPYTCHVTKQQGREWKLSVLEARNIQPVFNHSPEKCLQSLIMQMEAKGRKVVRV